MILSYRKREDSPPNEVSGACQVVKRSSRPSEPKDEPARGKKQPKPYRGFWSNFFRPPTQTDEEKRKSLNLKESIPPPRRFPSPSSSSSSTESVNTILSTHSFSFVSPKSYAGQHHRKRGRRIPVEFEDKNFRRKPQQPQLKVATQKTRPPNPSGPGGTLSRIGMRFGLNLKSKYNLQSCESLAVCGTEVSAQNSVVPERSCFPPGKSSLSAQQRQQCRDLSAISRIASETTEENQNSVNNLIKVNQDRIPVDPPKKRRAPFPPPRTSSINNTLDSLNYCKQQEFTEAPGNSRAQQRHRRCQSDSAACERVKPRLHVRGKRRAPTPPTGVGPEAERTQELLVNPLPILVEKEEKMRMRSKKRSPSESQFPASYCHSPEPQITAHEQKPIPRPWYRRNPVKSPNKIQNPKPIINLPNFSKLDREATEIVEENRRRSAELNYKQTAKDLITLFNTTFSKVEENETSGGGRGTESLRMGAEGNSADPKAHADIIRKSVTTPSECDEKKKLAIVQPQKSEKVKGKLPITNSSVTTSNLMRQYDRGGLVRSTNDQDGEQWACPRCTLNNLGWRAFCDACFFRRGSPFVQNTPRLAQTVPPTASEPEPQVATRASIPQQNGGRRTTNENETERNATSNQKPKKAEFPPCQNFMHQMPNKDKLPKEKLVGVKLQDDSEGDGELDISALREARVAFFSKNSTNNDSDYKLNNFNPLEIGTEFKELNLPPVETPSGKDEGGDDDLEVIDFLLKINQEAESSPFLNGSWKSTKFRPIYAAISENNSNGDPSEFELIYNDLRRNAHSNGNNLADTFMRNNIQSLIRNQLERYEAIMEDGSDLESGESNVESMVEAFRKQGAVPKHLVQRQAGVGGPLPIPADHQSRKGHAKRASDLLRKLDWAVTHGEYRLAAKLAYEVATLKVDPDKPKVEEPFTIRVYVEDRMMQQGPFLVSVTQSMTVGKLKTKIESDWSIPTTFQKWILGKKMAEGDDDLLVKYSMKNESLAFLYLITPEFGHKEEKEMKASPPSQELKNELKEVNVLSPHSTKSTEKIRVPSCEEKILNGTGSSAESFISTVDHPFKENATGNFENKNTQNSLGVYEPAIKRTNPGKDNMNNFVENFESKKYNEVKILDGLSSKNFDSKVPLEEILTSVSSPARPSEDAFVVNSTVLVSNSTNSFPARFKTSEGTPLDPQNYQGASRRSSLGDSQKKRVVHVPFTRRLSGTLTKQIQMFEALNSPQKIPASAQAQKYVDLFPEVSKSEAHPRINGIIRNTPELFRMENRDSVGRIQLAENQDMNYKKLLELEKSDLIRSEDTVDCPICLSQVTKGQGVVLRDCLHSFCQDCLAGSIEHSEDPEVKCPFRDKNYSCESVLQEREIKALVSTDVFHRLLEKSVTIAECKMSNAFHCQTNGCPGWCIFEDTVNVFLCPVCSKSNCLNCRAIHEGLNCQQYQRQRAIAAETDEDAKSSRLMLEKMIQRGEALDCPACHVVLLKKWGCDWVRCSYCKTEICWVTKSFRWGPNGKGDTSGGCKCGVNGVKCHPKCTYCH